MANKTIASLREMIDYDQTLIIRPNKGKKLFEAVLKDHDDTNIAKVTGDDPAAMVRSLANKVKELDE